MVGGQEQQGAVHWVVGCDATGPQPSSLLSLAVTHRRTAPQPTGQHHTPAVATLSGTMSSTTPATGHSTPTEPQPAPVPEYQPAPFTSAAQLEQTDKADKLAGLASDVTPAASAQGAMDVMLDRSRR